MLKNIFAILILVSLNSFLVFYICNFKKLLFKFKNYLSALTSLIKIFSDNKFDLNYKQNKLDEFSKIGMILVFNIIIFIIPFAIFSMVMYFSKINIFQYDFILIPTIPYLILLKK
tara:strand:+ start:345 stop:689 length:345 start_codon:yes stop_codon:yes gene_type:complete